MFGILFAMIIAANVAAGPMWVRIYVSSRDEVNALIKDGIDDITAVDLKVRWVDALVPQDKADVLQKYDFVTLDPNVAESFEKAGLKIDFGPYYTYAEAVQELDRLRAEYPNIISEKWSIGEGWQGNTIWAIRISDNPDVDEDEPVAHMNAAIHAREPGAVSTVFGFIHYLVRNYGVDPKVTWLVDNRELYIVPILNPDGYIYNEIGDGYWRKNMRDNNNNGHFDEYYDGVDLNRNYGYMWGYDDIGSSPEPSSQTYRGPSPFSEPETQAIREFADSIRAHTVINYHTYSNLVIYPWGYIDQPTPDQALFEAMAQIMTRANGYDYGRPAQLLYPVNGEANDWFYGEQNEKPKAFSFVVEVGEAFWQPDTNIILEQINENIPLNMYILEAAGHYIDVDNFIVMDQNGDSRIDPGDTVSMSLTLRNMTPDGPEFDGVEVAVFPVNDDIIPLDSSAYVGHIGLFPNGFGETQTPITFVVSASLGPTDTLKIGLHIWDGSGFDEINSLDLPLGQLAPLPYNPIGPDGYGYYAYEDADVFAQAPEFDWVEIAPSAGGNGTPVSLSDDDNTVVNLPFTFKFYGIDYNQITICSNGWIALGTESSTSYTNNPIPDEDSPNRLVAAFWCDLNPSQGGQIAYFYDSDNHRFIVEYHAVPHYYNSDPETFEVIFYDPSYYTTPTGDGVIVVQYQTVQRPNSATVGIENASGTVGLQYQYENQISPFAYGLQNGRAIKFTTESPTPAVAEDDEDFVVSERLWVNIKTNPVINGILEFSIGMDKKSDVELSLYDINGRRVLRKYINSLNTGNNTMRLELQNLPSGLYFLKVSPKVSDRKIVRKIVILR